MDCGCSEFVEWSNIPKGVPHADVSWHILRDEILDPESPPTALEVGSLTARECRFVDRDNDQGQVWVCKRIPPRWFFALDRPPTEAGARYRYWVKVCNNNGCNTGASAVDYVAAPYACFKNGGLVDCKTEF